MKRRSVVVKQEADFDATEHRTIVRQSLPFVRSPDTNTRISIVRQLNASPKTPGFIVDMKRELQNRSIPSSNAGGSLAHKRPQSTAAAAGYVRRPLSQTTVTQKMTPIKINKSLDIPNDVIEAARIRGQASKTVKRPIAVEPTKSPVPSKRQFPVPQSKLKPLLRCSHCVLSFISPVWLNKHMEREHPTENSMAYEIREVDDTIEYEEECKPAKKMQNLSEGGIQNQLQQLVKTQQTFSNVTQKLIKNVNVIKSKSNTNRTTLREKLRKQLQAQQELIRVQQEIFMKASQTQNDILQLMADLEDDEDVDGEEELEEDPLENENQLGVVKYQQFEPEEEVQTEYILGPEVQAEDDNVFVIMTTEDGDEEYELMDIEEEPKWSEISLEVYPNTDGDSSAYHIVEAPPADAPDKRSMRQPKAEAPVAKDRKPIIAFDGEITERDLQTMNDAEIAQYVAVAVQSVEPDEEGRFKCPLCDEKFGNRYSVGPHMQRIHCKQKSKECPYCHRAFTCTGDLTRHIRIHTGDKPFKCTFPNCSYAFRASGDLHKHMRRHNESEREAQRKHVCMTCGRAFERLYDLRRHKLTHVVQEGEDFDGYQCEHCPAKFARKDQYRVHLMRHMGMKPYNCPKCSNGFADISSCNKHIARCQFDGTNIECYECEYCHKKLISKMGIKIHVEKCWQMLRLDVVKDSPSIKLE